MSKEIDILEVLEDNPNMSQREISKRTNFSLGVVNSLIKKCVKKGLLKTEQLNSRTIKYILTPQGIKEKTKKTLKYIKRSYHQIIKVSKKIEKSIEYSKGKELYILGEKDEVYEIAKKVLEDKKKKYKYVSNGDDIKKEDAIALLWDVELEDSLEVEYINIVEKQ